MLVSHPRSSTSAHVIVGGKDRTALIVALLLDLAGVSDADILEDYLLTADLLAGEYTAAVRLGAEARGVAWGTIAPLLACRAEYMENTLEHLDARYGGAAAYLARAGVDPVTLEALRSALVA